MEYEFEIRRNESRLQTEYAGGTGHTSYGMCHRHKLAGGDLTAGIADRYAVGSQGADGRNYDIRTDETSPAKSESDIRSGAGECREDTESNVGNHDVRNIEAESGGGEPVLTGWEAERADLIAAEMLRRAEQEARLQAAHGSGSDRAPAPDFIGGIAAVASIIEDEPADNTEYAREHVDSRALAEERERKEAHGIHM